MSKIVTKTGIVNSAQSKARVVVEICDTRGTCCQTSDGRLGRGLDNNPGIDRQKGQTDIYTDTAIIGNCAEKVVGDPKTVKLTTSDPDGNDGCITFNIIHNHMFKDGMWSG